MRSWLMVAVLATVGLALPGCGGAKQEQPKTLVTYDKARDGEPATVGPTAKQGKSPKADMMKGGGQ